MPRQRFASARIERGSVREMCFFLSFLFQEAAYSRSAFVWSVVRCVDDVDTDAARGMGGEQHMQLGRSSVEDWPLMQMFAKPMWYERALCERNRM